MSRILISATVIITIIVTIFALISNLGKLRQAQITYQNMMTPQPSKSELTITNSPTPATMKITSPVFENNSPIPPQYTCDGDNINPPLLFSDIPTYTQSLVLIIDDPDAPKGNWVHWLVWNIDPKTTQIETGTAPKESVQGKNNFGTNSYGGPCPPSGTHRYQFKLYALDNRLQLDRDNDKSQILKSIDNHILSEAMLTGLYSRER
jgi:Raf kinase inhibitor-like YbhB/YbcL family protein